MESKASATRFFLSSLPVYFLLILLLYVLFYSRPFLLCKLTVKWSALKKKLSIIRLFYRCHTRLLTKYFSSFHLARFCHSSTRCESEMGTKLLKFLLFLKWESNSGLKHVSFIKNITLLFSVFISFPLNLFTKEVKQ